MYNTDDSKCYNYTQRPPTAQQVKLYDGSGFDVSNISQDDYAMCVGQQTSQSYDDNQAWGNTEPVAALSNYSSPYLPYPAYDTNYLIPNVNPTPTTTAGLEFNLPTSDFTSFEDEPPLLEELGIKPDEIFKKTMAVLNPMRKIDASILEDTGLAGPLLFVFVFGGCLLLSGKAHFNCIYAIVVMGCLAINALVNAMSLSGSSLSVSVTASVLGYCLLPLVILTAVNVFVCLKSIGGIILIVLAILWCSFAASKLLFTALAMHNQQGLVAYACALFYTALAQLTIF